MSAAVPSLRLVGPRERLEIRDRALLGRDESCDLVVVDKSISRRHAAVEWDGEHWIVQDLESANGIHLQGRRVNAAELFDGAELMLGSVLFRVEIEGVAAADPAATDPEDFATRLSIPLPILASPPLPPAPPAAPAPTVAFDSADDMDLPAAQPVLSVESLAEPVRPAVARAAAPVAPRSVANGPSLLFLAWFVPNVLLAALGLYFFLGAQKGGAGLAAIEAESRKVEAERLGHLQAGALLAEGAPEALVLCNRGAAPVPLAWIGALYRQGDESIRNFNSDYCPDQALPVVAPGADLPFRSSRERPAECRWDGSKPLVVAWRPVSRSAGFRVVRMADLQGKCLDLSR